VIGRADLPDLGYDARLSTLLAAGVGLWDTIVSARREGSLDAAIRHAEAAPLRELVATLPCLQAVGFNGAKSAQIGRKALAGTALALIDLPSSSPANAALLLAAKQEKWLQLGQFLEWRT
jgi:hypoxanthine-DNA glycosylase